MTALEQEFYEIAGKELATKRPVVALMTKAFSDSDGDERRAVALYIKLRVSQLALEYQSTLDRQQRAAREQAERKTEEEKRRRKARPFWLSMRPMHVFRSYAMEVARFKGRPLREAGYWHIQELRVR